jgi:hypothetical protein
VAAAAQRMAEVPFGDDRESDHQPAFRGTDFG